MTTRRRFTADFKVKVALEALHGDKTIQEIAPGTRCIRTRRARGSGRRWTAWVAIFSNGVDKVHVDHESEIHSLHAKIGQLTVARDCLARGLKR